MSMGDAQMRAWAAEQHARRQKLAEQQHALDSDEEDGLQDAVVELLGDLDESLGHHRAAERTGDDASETLEGGGAEAGAQRRTSRPSEACPTRANDEHAGAGASVGGAGGQGDKVQSSASGSSAPRSPAQASGGDAGERCAGWVGRGRCQRGGARTEMAETMGWSAATSTKRRCETSAKRGGGPEGQSSTRAEEGACRGCSESSPWMPFVHRLSLV